MKIKTSFRFAFLLVAVMLVGIIAFTGCASDEGGSDETTTSNDDVGNGSSDGDSGNGDSDGSGSVSSATYLFYYDENGNIYAVDPENLISRQLVDSGITAEEDVYYEVDGYYACTHNSTNNTISDWHMRYVLYFKDGRIYKVSTLKSDSLTPIQVSSETGAVDICPFTDEHSDFANIDNSVSIYRMSGADGDCDTSDDIVKMVTLGMSSTDAPTILNVAPFDITGYLRHYFIESIYNMSDFSIAGFLMIDLNSDLVECDTDFSNCTTVKTSVSDFTQYSVPNSNIIIVAIIDDEDLYTYDWTANTLTPLYVSSNSVGSNRSDGSAMYFEDGSKIFRIDYNDFSVTELVDRGTNDIKYYELTDSKVVYVVGPPLGSNGTYEMKAIPKAGGTAVTIMTTDIIGIYATSDNHIYYIGGNGAGHIKDDGSGLSEITNARYAGAAYYTTWNIFSSSNTDRILRLDGCTDDGDCAGATLKSFDAATYSNELILGTLPDDISGYWGYGYGWGNQWLYSSSEPTDDIFFVDVTEPNSLQRITDSPSLDEWVIH